MKTFGTFVAASVIAAASLAGAASAGTFGETFIESFKTGDVARSALEKIAPGAGATDLSNAQAIAVYQAVQDESGSTNARARAEAMIGNYQ